MEVGSEVVVKAPFSEAFTGVYTIEQISTAEDGQAITYLVGIESAFSPDHLELIT